MFDTAENKEAKAFLSDLQNVVKSIADISREVSRLNVDNGVVVGSKT